MMPRVQKAYDSSNKLSKNEPYKDGFHTFELMKRNNPKTPDFLSLKMRNSNLVFVYGTLKCGGRLHGALNNCPSLGDGRTVTTLFRMYDTGSFPVVLRTGKEDQKAAPVFGEIYVVDPVTMLDLDEIEGNNYLYKREEIFVFAYDQSVPSKEGRGMIRPGVKCWTYVGMPVYWENVSSMLPVHTKYNDGKPYYDYDLTKSPNRG